MARKVLLLLLLIAFLTIASEKGSGSISISRAIEPVHEVNFSRDILPILSD